MNGETTERKIKAPTATDWDRLRTMSGAELHAAVESDPDAYPTDEEFWKEAEVIWPR